MSTETNAAVSTGRRTAKLVKMGAMVAISVVLVYLIHFPIFPAVAFLEYDPADIPILIGTFAFGPVVGLILTVVTSVVQGLTVSASNNGGCSVVVRHGCNGGCYDGRKYGDHAGLYGSPGISRVVPDAFYRRI